MESYRPGQSHYPPQNHSDHDILVARNDIAFQLETVAIRAAHSATLHSHGVSLHLKTVAIRGALLYFLVDQLWVLAHIYRFSMANFVYMFKKGMDNADIPEVSVRGLKWDVVDDVRLSVSDSDAMGTRLK